MDRRSLIIGLLAGAWVATLALLLLPTAPQAAWLGTRAHAEDPPGESPNPNGPRSPGPTVNPIDGYATRGGPNPGGGTSDSNHRAIALSASIGSGQSAVWYFDTLRERVLVYAYEPGSKGGLKLMAARHIDMDLKLEDYNDISAKTRSELKEAYDQAFGAAPEPVAPAGSLPTKKVSLPGGK
ncbi:MAG: hypothetical protein ACKOCB_10110 [Planctomycetia bacterium]